MANPPFMTPKGGVVPHTKFRIAAKKAEVLFTDYIAEHLSTNGRAGIIVPEGIIFQSGTAYKALRKFLVEDSLVAVIALPSGVFNPYSGVKTSILILDKGLARQSDSIAFFKVENDGYDLGAQRRAIDKNDLPRLTKEIHEYLGKVRSGKKVKEEDDLHLVPKARIAASGEYNFSAERYREGKNRNSVHTKVTLETIAEVRMGETLIKGNLTGKGKPIFSADSSNEAWAYSDTTKLSFGKNTIVIGARGTIGSVKFPRLDCFTCTQTTIAITANENQILPDFLYYWLKEYDFNQITEGMGIPMITVANVNRIEIPLPPLEIQKEIVAEIEGYQKVIDGARAVVENYKPQIPIDPEWPMVELGEACSIGGEITQDVDLALPYFGADSLEANTGRLLKTETAKNQRVNGPVYKFSGNRLLYSKIRPYLNKLSVVDLEGYCSSDMYPLVPDKKRLQIEYLAFFMLSELFLAEIKGFYERASIPKINRTQLFSVKIPIPSLDIQKAIVDEIEKEQALVNANKELIARFEKKIQAVMDRVWGNGSPD
jgi:type I restriction enzyme M protein